jgi:NADPH:quinone reductase-like Zn-dependent oxidoreductase
MKAVRYHEFGAADTLRVDEIDRPTPAADEVLVEVRAASVNPVDVMIRTGEYGQVPLPTVPGGDGAGVVVSVGESVERVADGDRVVVSGLDRAVGGTFAEYVAVPETKLAPLPEDVPWDVGAAIGNVGATAWTALTEVADVDPGDRVLIHGGAGGVGHVAVQVAATAGAEVIATAGSAEARDRLEDLGAAATVPYDSDALAADVRAATGGAGVDTVLDHRLGDYLGVDFDVLTDGGQVVGIMGHVPETSAEPFYRKELTVSALRMDARPERTPMLERICRLLRRDEVTAVVADTYGFDEADQAHRDLVAGGYVGKLVVTP